MQLKPTLLLAALPWLMLAEDAAQKKVDQSFVLDAKPVVINIPAKLKGVGPTDLKEPDVKAILEECMTAQHAGTLKDDTYYVIHLVHYPNQKPDSREDAWYVYFKGFSSKPTALRRLNDPEYEKHYKQARMFGAKKLTFLYVHYNVPAGALDETVAGKIAEGLVKTWTGNGPGAVALANVLEKDWPLRLMAVKKLTTELGIRSDDDETTEIELKKAQTGLNDENKALDEKEKRGMDAKSALDARGALDRAQKALDGKKAWNRASLALFKLNEAIDRASIDGQWHEAKAKYDTWVTEELVLRNIKSSSPDRRELDLYTASATRLVRNRITSFQGADPVGLIGPDGGGLHPLKYKEAQIYVEDSFLPIKYTIDVSKKTPSVIDNLKAVLGGFNLQSNVRKLILPMEPYALTSVKLDMAITYPTSDIVIAGQRDKDRTSIGSITYDNERMYWFDFGFALPLKKLGELSFDGASLKPKQVEKSRVYGTVNLFPLGPVNTKSTTIWRLAPQIIYGMALTTKPWDNHLFGVGLGLKYVQPFAGISLSNLQVRPATETDSGLKWTARFTWGLNISVGSIAKVIKGGAGN